MRSNDKSTNTNLDICISDTNHDKSESGSDNKQLSELVSDMKLVVKIVASLGLSDDDDDSANFMSSFQNYSAVSKRVSKHNLTDELIYDEDPFNKDPVKAWLTLMSVAMVALYAAHVNGMTCEIINDESDEKNGLLGAYYSIKINLDLLDWNMHSVSLLVPANPDQVRTTLVVDHEIRLFC